MILCKMNMPQHDDTYILLETLIEAFAGRKS